MAMGRIKERNIAGVYHRRARCIALVTEIEGACDIGAKVRARREAMEKTSFYFFSISPQSS